MGGSCTLIGGRRTWPSLSQRHVWWDGRGVVVDVNPGTTVEQSNQERHNPATQHKAHLSGVAWSCGWDSGHHRETAGGMGAPAGIDSAWRRRRHGMQMQWKEMGTMRIQRGEVERNAPYL